MEPTALMDRPAVKEHSHDCGCGCRCREPEQCAECCGLDCLEAPRFFCGQLLSDQQLTRLMTWTRAKTRLARYREGWGVACGLDIRCDETQAGGVVISPGYARSCCGDDIVVCEDARLDLSTECDEGPDPCEELEPRPKQERRDKREEAAKYAEPPAVDVFIAYSEEQTHPEASLARTACGETGRCEYTRTRETHSLYTRRAGSGDPLSYAALRWREAYDEALEVIDAFRAAFTAFDGDEGEEVRTWLLNWVGTHRPHHFCFIREHLCAAAKADLTNEAELSLHLFRIAQDRRNRLLTCSCFDCGPDRHGVPLGRVWLDPPDGTRRCRIRTIDPFPPYRRPLSPECWPAPLGYVNAGQVIWHRRADACIRLADLGVRVEEVVEFEPSTIGELRSVLACDPMVACGEERTLLTYDMGPYGERVIGLCETRAPTVQPPKLTVVKRGDPSEGVAGSFVRYEYGVTNEGDEAFDAQVEDKDTNLSEARRVEPGTTETFTGALDVPGDATEKFTNTVTVTATGPGGTTTKTASHDFRVIPPPGEPPSIDLTLRAPSEVGPRSRINYTLIAVNDGPVDVTLMLSDQLGELPPEARDEIPLAPGEQAPFRYSYLPLPGETRVTEVVDAVATSADGQQATGREEAITTVSRQILVPAEPAESGAPLLEIAGIGQKREERLREGGITSLRDLMSANRERIVQLVGSPPVTPDDVRVWQQQARLLLER